MCHEVFYLGEKERGGVSLLGVLSVRTVVAVVNLSNGGGLPKREAAGIKCLFLQFYRGCCSTKETPLYKGVVARGGVNWHRGGTWDVPQTYLRHTKYNTPTNNKQPMHLRPLQEYPHQYQNSSHNNQPSTRNKSPKAKNERQPPKPQTPNNKSQQRQVYKQSLRPHRQR